MSVEVTPAMRHRLLEMARAGVAHETARALVPELDSLALSAFPETPEPAPEKLRIAAWNVQHCHYPGPSGRLLASQKFDLVLLSELDRGMHRSGQADTPALLADAQGHGHVFGCEFLELHGEGPEDAVGGAPGGNLHGLHGNGLTARYAPRGAALLRLPAEADWFNAPRRGQYRVGGRMAVAARLALGPDEIVAVSVHLESDTDAAGRGRQMAALLRAIDTYAAGRPVVIGGDFNAGARLPDFDHRAEAIFDVARAHGYGWEGANLDCPTSRQSRIVNAVQQDRAHYDWFFLRGLVPQDPEVIAAVDDNGDALSDHEIIAVTVARAS